MIDNETLTTEDASLAPSATFTHADVESWLTPQEVDKGSDYLEAVDNLDVGDDAITADVQGTADKPYHVHVKLAADGRRFPRSMRCTCPVGMGCKHVAATLLKVLEQRDAPAVPTAGPWMAALRLLSGAPAPAAKVSKLPHRLYWMLAQQGHGEFSLKVFKGRSDGSQRLPDGLDAWAQFESALVRPMKYVDDDDLHALRLLASLPERAELPSGSLAIARRQGYEALLRLLECGRLYAEVTPPVRLRSGPARPARIAWQVDEGGLYHARAEAEPPIAWAIPLDPPTYVDAESGEVGRLEFDVPPEVASHLLAAPPLNEREAHQAALVLADRAPGAAPPLTGPLPEVDASPSPRLELTTFYAPAIHWLRDYPRNQWRKPLDVAEVRFRYEDVLVSARDGNEVAPRADGTLVRVRRKLEQESELIDQLRLAGFEFIPPGAVQFPADSNFEQRSVMVLASEDAWPDFMSDGLAPLEDTGWQLVIPADFRHHALSVDAWEADFVEAESGWFDLDMGIVVEGRRLPLAPLLAELFQHDGRWLDAYSLSNIPATERIDLHTPEGRRIRVPAERLKPLARTLIDLFDGAFGGRKDGNHKLRVSRLDAPRLAGIGDHWHSTGMNAVKQAATNLDALLHMEAVPPPAGLALTLRQYQLEGLAWLQHLRIHKLAGILADDMGLGKTAQALAHLLVEKDGGRLGPGGNGPALVILPTSLMFNWKTEAARFAPGLSVLSLQGKERKESFALIPKHDVVLTTYPLLWRDADELAKHDYHYLILDEAQSVKNAASQGAGVVRQLKAQHRLCLTGTPLENHLGELWSQFDFLLPGFLGERSQFTKQWRTPIERHGDTLRRELLASRIRPFVLRRRKEDVAKELPPKSIMLRTVELEGGQRDLYETVRSAMDARVREEIAARGFARSQIVILDALLKLRQVCCDPRLVKSTAAQRVKERAKLELLMTMLPELVAEGRRILIFSQFTTMLGLIEDELEKAGIGYVTLTGETRDRETPIRRFQAEEVPVFLISLKAGGVGLNLIAADTVIHYDPWWNPAVENQATDRAHRIGQTKRVFVYKLVVAGSIEEKILALQEMKADLAAGILSDDRAGDVKFTEADIRALLEPLPVSK